MSQAFAERITRAPIPYDTRAARIAWERLSENSAETAAVPHADARMRGLLEGVFGNSPFLTRTILKEADWISAALRSAPEEVFDGLIERMCADARSAQSNAEVVKLLRVARARAAALIALADLGGVWDLFAVTRALTRLADAAVSAALHRLLTEAAARGQLRLKDPAEPEGGSGFVVLAMGKYGAFELNYSSDIDLIILYDRAVMPLAPDVEPGPLAVRLAQDLSQMLQERTEDGYVFRVDLRLRPDGGASPVAISTDSAEQYYEAAGQNWERAALIKARACAGDIAAGERFLKALAPYIWRKHLDFAAIEDIHSIKRQIHAQKGHGEIAVLGHNVKLGRGGIREIEFFAQTQQLILGGRDPDLRVRATCDALSVLAGKGHIEGTARDELRESYVFLRTLEHRLQMIEDEQTHTLPKTQDGIDHIARFCGFAKTAEFERELRAHLARVQAHYAELFEESETLASEAGSLVFTGVEDDPETLATLTRLGFKRGKDISVMIRAWQHGRIRATRSVRAREGLTRLVPLMLSALARTAEPDGAFIEFAHFVEAVPTGVQLFALLVSNPQLLDLLFELFSLAPRLSRVLAAQPAILDSLLAPDRDDAGEAAERALAAAIARAPSIEAKLDEARIFAREHQFRVAVDLLTTGVSGVAAGEAFTQTAEAVIRGLLPVAEGEMGLRHGRIEGGAWAVIGLGKLGGREMTATSDLDLVFVYDFDPAREMSNGERPMAAGEYFARTGQRLVSLLTVPTREGKLYEVDLRLRPSGRAGPIAVTLTRLKTYHETQAWTFEHMALTRARFIAGSAELGARAQAIVRGILTTKRDPGKLSADALDMRARLAAAKPVSDPWALKQVRGGLVDLEYIAQVLQLAHSSSSPEILSTSTLGALENVKRLGLMPKADADSLIDAVGFLSHLSQVMQVAYDEERAPDEAAAVRARFATILGEISYEAIERRLLETEACVRERFEKYVAGLPTLFAH